MILVDYIGHMVSTENEQQLHRFAKELGLKREWYQTPGYGQEHAHYDLTTSRMKNKALRRGAVEVRPEELIKRAWWRKDYLKRVGEKE